MPSLSLTIIIEVYSSKIEWSIATLSKNIKYNILIGLFQLSSEEYY